MSGDEKVAVDRSELWNAAEKAEKRKDGRTAREIVVNLPHELSEQQRGQLVDDFAKSLARRYQCGVDYAVHLPDEQGDQRNHHAHIMLTTRQLELGQGVQLGDKTLLELSNRKLKELEMPKTQEQIGFIREHWANMANARFVAHGIDASIDHRSHAERGLDTKPSIKLGWKASELERQGIRTASGEINRKIASDNQLIRGLKLEIKTLDEAQTQMQTAKQSIKDEYRAGADSFKAEYEEYKRQREAQKQSRPTQKRHVRTAADVKQERTQERDNDRGLEL